MIRKLGNNQEFLPLMNKQIQSTTNVLKSPGDYSLDPDIRLGYSYFITISWKPDSNFEGSPIPTQFNFEDQRISIALNYSEENIVYYGFRPQDSLYMHEAFHKGNYPFDLPSKDIYILINAVRTYKTKYRAHRPLGMVKNEPFIFDSNFESGNLDLVVRVKEGEYDLYMKPDSNTRGHHQWFYFSIQTQTSRHIKLNIVNFTKRNSLYTNGIRVSIFSEKKSQMAKKGKLPELYKDWHKGGNKIIYKLSKFSQELYRIAKIR